MKWLLLLSICFCLCLLSGCNKDLEKETPASPPVLELSQELPLTDEELEQPVPDFLDEDLQQLYRRARNVYDHLFIETVGCEYRDTFQPGTFPDAPEEAFEEQGGSYRYASGPYQSWADLDALVHSVFTDRLFQELNAMGARIPPYTWSGTGGCAFSI